MSGEFAVKGMCGGDADNPALRLPLGSTAYDNIEAALTQRLEALRAMKSVAYGADRQE